MLINPPEASKVKKQILKLDIISAGNLLRKIVDSIFKLNYNIFNRSRQAFITF